MKALHETQLEEAGISGLLKRRTSVRAGGSLLGSQAGERASNVVEIQPSLAVSHRFSLQPMTKSPHSAWRALCTKGGLLPLEVAMLLALAVSLSLVVPPKPATDQRVFNGTLMPPLSFGLDVDRTVAGGVLGGVLGMAGGLVTAFGFEHEIARGSSDARAATLSLSLLALPFTGAFMGALLGDPFVPLSPRIGKGVVLGISFAGGTFLCWYIVQMVRVTTSLVFLFLPVPRV